MLLDNKCQDLFFGAAKSSYTNNILHFMILLIPSLGMFAGRSAAVTVSCLLLVMLFKTYSHALVSKLRMQHHILEISFLALILISCFWSIDIKFSASNAVFVSLIWLSYIYIDRQSKQFLYFSVIFKKTFVLSTIIAIIIFYIEFCSHGFFSRAFRMLQNKEQLFHLYFLNTGCSMLSLLTWVGVGILLREGKNKSAASFFFASLVTAYYSDSSASFLALFLSGILFLLFNISSRFFCSLLFIIPVFLISVIAMLAFSYLIDPMEISQTLDWLPISSKHRLFIYHFVAERIMDNPFFGVGFSASRFVEVAKEDIIIYNNLVFHPLPLHPHNVLLQILLENGIVGFSLSIAILCKYIIRINYLWVHKEISADVMKVSYCLMLTIYIVSLISYNMWQSWWISTITWSVLAMKLFVYNRQNQHSK